MVPDIIENPQMALEFVIDKSLKFIKRKKVRLGKNRPIDYFSFLHDIYVREL